MSEVVFHDLGLIEYHKAWNYQEKLFNETTALKANNRDTASDQQLSTKNHLIFCEHPPVITLGKSGNQENLLLSEPLLKQNNISFYKINRGGDITYHGPGQVVGYPILDLDYFFTDIDKYLRRLEEMIILTLAELGVSGGRVKGATGVWIDGEDPAKARKICAMGIRCSRWVTMHGFALNVNTNLEHFNYIVPCGITGKQVTSMQKELGRTVDQELVKDILKKHFSNLFNIAFTTI